MKLQGGAGLELEIKRIKREAEKLISVDPAAAFTTLGIIACFERKISEMHQFHKNALALSNEAIHLANYAISLSACGLLEEALEYAKRAYDECQSDLTRRRDALDLIIDLTYQLGRLEEFFSYADQWQRLTGKKHLRAADLIDFSEKHGLRGHLATAIRLLNDCFAGARGGHLKLEHDPETEEEWLVIEFEIGGKIEDILNSYDHFTGLWISSVPWPEREKIRLSYIAV